MRATIYHNPRCSKSRNSLQILIDSNIEIDEVRYLDNPPTKEKLRELCEQMNKKPLEIIRTGEALFKELGLKKTDSKSDEEWLDILIANPKLIERPIVQIGNKSVMGRPPENVLELLK